MTSDASASLDANDDPTITTAAASVSTVTLSIRHQCPLCFDVLRRPILLPCCRRHLCMECFERALELTSVNCGFCRKRIVGFARKKQYKVRVTPSIIVLFSDPTMSSFNKGVVHTQQVDNALWNEILAKCPFIGAAMISTTGSIALEEPSWAIEFIDELAAPRHASHAESQELKPGELKKIYEQRVREHQSQLEQEEALALEKTMDFLQSDPEYLASVARHDDQPTPQISIRAAPTTSQIPQERRIKTLHKVALHSDKSSAPPKQQRLDTFFSSSTESLDSIAVSQSPSSHRSKLLKLGHTHISVLHHRDPHSPRRRKPAVIQTTLLQLSSSSSVLTLNSTPRSGASSLKITPSEKRKLSQTAKPKSTDTPNRRTSWRCAQCTFENTCFDRQCSMCHAAPPPLLQ